MKYLIDETYLKEKTTVNIQKDGSKVRVALDNIDYFYVRKLLGVPLHKLFLDSLNGVSGVTLTQTQAHVLDLSQRYCAILTHWDMLADLPVKTVEKGAIEPDGSADLNTIKYRRQELYSKAETVKQDILDLLVHSDFATLYTLPPKKTQGFSSLIFD